LQLIYILLFLEFLFIFILKKTFQNLLVNQKNFLEELSLRTNFSNDDWEQWIAIKTMEKELNFTLFNILKLKRLL
jgi:hypothetical protein